MIRTILTLATLLISLNAFAAKATKPVAQSPDHRLLHAIAQIQSGAKDKAAETFETIFFDKNVIESEKMQAGLALAFTDDRFLKKQKRHEYARFLIDNHKERLSSQDRSALLRVAGDGFFKAADLNEAERFYNELSDSQDSFDVDYAQYKLGWIDLNRNGQERAFVRWIRSVKDSEGREQQLRKSLIRDLGRAWAETDPVNSTQTDLIDQMKLNESERSDLIYGILAGLRRRQNIPAFRTELFKTNYAEAVFKGVLERGMGLTQIPCSILDWMDQAEAIKITKVPTATLLPRLNNCYKYLKESLGAAWQQDQRSTALLNTYERLDLRGLDRLPRSGIYKDMGKPELYCQEFLATEKENFESTKKPMANELLGEALSTCVTSTYRTNFIEYVLSSSSHFVSTPIPLLLAEAMTAQERLTSGESMLAQFGPRPLDLKDKNSEVWIETLRQVINKKLTDKQFDTAVEVLERHIPLAQVTTERSLELWTLVASYAQPTDENQNRVAQKVIEIQLNMLPKKATAEQSIDMLTLANRFGMMSMIWKNWNKFDTKAFEKTTLITDLFQRTYLLILDEKAIEIEPLLKQSLIGQVILRAAEITKTFSLNLSKKDLSSIKDIHLPGPEAPKFIKDLRTILTLHEGTSEIDKLKLKLDTRLAGKIESGVRTIKKQMATLEQSVWSHPKLLRLARFTIAETCASLSMKISRIPQPKGITPEQAVQWKAQFENIISTIANWKNSILGGA